MDRTADFHKIIGKQEHTPLPSSPFIRAAKEQRLRLNQLKHRLQIDPAHKANAIQACQNEMDRCRSELEPLIPDKAELSPEQRRKMDDLLDHRKAVVSGLFEEIQNLVSSVQSSQVNELQHEAEVAGYFTAMGSRSSKAQAAPKFDDELLGGVNEIVGVPNDEALDAEAQSLLAMFSNDMDQMQETQRKTQEVTALVTQFAMELTRQKEVIDNVATMGEESIEHVQQAKKHLDQAAKNKDSYRFYVMLWFIGSAIFLLIFDFLDARYSFI
mmetsp:Transcript_65148/g.103180  ORF Transcript_65148/g.103180 Transcript_65148/m.103180 type:complete len:270 (+) Transcript_65148:102-911(+)